MNVLIKLTFAFAVLASTWLAPAVARADEVIVITGGTYTVGSSFFFNGAAGLTDGGNYVLSAVGQSNVPSA